MNIESVRLVVAAWLLLAVPGPAAAQDWMLTTAPLVYWDSIACSADGNQVIALSSYGSIYISTDSGASWTAATNAAGGYWYCAAISADGSKLAAGMDGDQIYTSHDYGVTWTATLAPTNYWESMACSSNGNVLVAAPFSNGLDNTTPGHICVSHDSGATWNAPVSLSPHFWLSVASSADGSRLIAAASDGTIWMTVNSGTNWSQTSAPNEPWFSVASSANGNKLVAAANAGPIGISDDGGTNWCVASNAPSAGWASVASSSDGQRLAAVQWGGQVYASTDGGANWAPRSVPDTLSAGGLWTIASSADGSKLFAAGDGYKGGPIYIAQPLPLLKITSGRSNAVISWPAAAAGFTVQQNSNLTTTNWIDVVALPQLTNGWNRMTAPTAVGSLFYRLRFPTGTPPSGHGPPQPR